MYLGIIENYSNINTIKYQEISPKDKKYLDNKYLLLYKWDSQNETLKEFIDIFKFSYKNNKNIRLCIIDSISEYKLNYLANINHNFHMFQLLLKRKFTKINSLKFRTWSMKYKNLRGKIPTVEDFYKKNLLK